VITRNAIASVLLLVTLPAPLSGQEQKVRERAADAFEEVETGTLTLRFFNALSGSPIKGGQIAIGDSGIFVTDFEGKVLFPAPEEDGTVMVRFSAPGFITSEFTIEIMNSSLYFNRYSISPVMELRFLRVVLDWGEEPRDLDLHFVKEDGYHISYRDMKTLGDGTGVLDRDDLDGYGPETITVKEISPTARYHCYVHDFSHKRDHDSNGLAQSRAMVKVYGDGRLLHLFSVPRVGAGTLWRVFDIAGGNVREAGEIAP